MESGLAACMATDELVCVMKSIVSGKDRLQNYDETSGVSGNDHIRSATFGFWAIIPEKQPFSLMNGSRGRDVLTDFFWAMQN